MRRIAAAVQPVCQIGFLLSLLLLIAGAGDPRIVGAVLAVTLSGTIATAVLTKEL